jgi:hypothetical protein
MIIYDNEIIHGKFSAMNKLKNKDFAYATPEISQAFKTESLALYSRFKA